MLRDFPDSLHIRRATIRDCAQIAAIYNEAVHDGTSTFDDFLVDSARYIPYCNDSADRAAIICGVVDDAIVAWASVERISDRNAYRYTALGSLYVKREWRGRGIGHNLIRALDDLAISLGYHSIVGEILTTNPQSVAMDIANGYKVVGELDQAGFRKGAWIGLIILQKRLDPRDKGPFAATQLGPLWAAFGVGFNNTRLSLLGLLLTIAALLLAILQVIQARQQTEDTRRHEITLGEIAASLSTHYLGPFPEYLSTVVRMIEEARTEILVVNANPTPAYFSSPIDWIDYRRAIDSRLHSGVAITMISATPEQRLKRMQTQFQAAIADWNRWSRENSSQLQTFLGQRYPGRSTISLELHEFLHMLVETQTQLSADLFALATCVEIDATITLQVWVADRRSAVFTIETTAANGLSHGLFTSDPKFVLALHSIAELYRST